MNGNVELELSFHDLPWTSDPVYVSEMAIIKPESCRAARQLLAWKQIDLARAAKVSIATVKKYELGQTNLIPVILAALERAFDEAGVELFGENGGGAGARLRQPQRSLRAPQDEEASV